MTSETGHFAKAAIDLIKTMQGYGLTAAAGQSADEELDFCVTVYHGKELLGCASLHEDRTWSCSLTISGIVFNCESTPWFSLPDGMDAALTSLTPTAVDASQPADPAAYNRGYEDCLYQRGDAPDYSLAPHLQRIVEGAKTAPQWDTESDRMAATDPTEYERKVAQMKEDFPNGI